MQNFNLYEMHPNEKYVSNLHSLERTWLHFWETNEGDNKFKVKFARDNLSKSESC